MQWLFFEVKKDRKEREKKRGKMGRIIIYFLFTYFLAALVTAIMISTCEMKVLYLA